jgi:hypothetical protein
MTLAAFSLMIELNDFYNDGMGWMCRHCDRELGKDAASTGSHSRMFREGEAEGKSPMLSNPALAKWADKTRRTLVCPRCGITELADIS